MAALYSPRQLARFVRHQLVRFAVEAAAEEGEEAPPSGGARGARGEL
jgi:hypothetical protein